MLLEDLAAGRVALRTLPDEAHVQFSTYCNMSCIMCWNGANPPTRDLSDEVIERLGEEFGDGLAILIPHDGSEPTARRWAEACAFARRYGLRMHLTTNVQGLSERRLRAALDVVTSIDLSLDSHRPEVLERIRPGARTKAIMRNLPRILAVAAEHDIECEINMVLLTANVDHVDESIEAFAALGAKAVTVIRMVGVNGASSTWDPIEVLGPETVARAHARARDAATRHGVRLRWLIDDAFESDEGADLSRDEPDRHAFWERVGRQNPGFCRFVHGGMRVTVDGDVTPCGYAGDRHLQLGNLRDETAQEIWNGATARDLRRSMYTRDLPRPCDTCIHALPLPPTSDLPMLADVPAFDAVAAAAHELLGPAHMERAVDPPAFELRVRGTAPDRVIVHLALGGEAGGRQIELPGSVGRSGTARYRIPNDAWADLRENQGYWWVVSVPDGDGGWVRITPEARCIVRHRDLARLAGSRLTYRDRVRGHDIDLGVRVQLSATRPKEPPRAVRGVQRLARKARPGGRTAGSRR